MAKRYLGGGVSFEQENVYQEFSEDDIPSGGGNLATLGDVDISNPTDGQVLVYNATSGKWENGEAAGGADIFVPLGTITAAVVPMSYSEDENAWLGVINTDIDVPDGPVAGRNLTVTIGGNTYSGEYITTTGWKAIDGGEGDTEALLGVLDDQPLLIGLQYNGETEPVITNFSVEVYTLAQDLRVFFESSK